MNYILRALQYSIDTAAFYTLFKINAQNVTAREKHQEQLILYQPCTSFGLNVISYSQLSDLLKCITPQENPYDISDLIENLL